MSLINIIAPFDIAYPPNSSVITNLFRLEIKRLIKYSIIYHVIITENMTSKILFSLHNSFNNKFNVCNFKSIFGQQFPTR